jgi:hypothetical protein
MVILAPKNKAKKAKKSHFKPNLKPTKPIFTHGKANSKPTD